MSNIAFYIYKSPKNDKFYWRLDETVNVGYNDGNEIYNIIATGHQFYDTIEEVKTDINKVISAIPSTKITYVGYRNDEI